MDRRNFISGALSLLPFGLFGTKTKEPEPRIHYATKKIVCGEKVLAKALETPFDRQRFILSRLFEECGSHDREKALKAQKELASAILVPLKERYINGVGLEWLDSDRDFEKCDIHDNVFQYAQFDKKHARNARHDIFGVYINRAMSYVIEMTKLVRDVNLPNATHCNLHIRAYEVGDGASMFSIRFASRVGFKKN